MPSAVEGAARRKLLLEELSISQLSISQLSISAVHWVPDTAWANQQPHLLVAWDDLLFLCIFIHGRLTTTGPPGGLARGRTIQMTHSFNFEPERQPGIDGPWDSSHLA